MTSFIQNKFNRYDLVAILLPGMVSIVVFSCIITGNFKETILGIKNLSFGGAVVFIIASYLFGKFVQTLSTLDDNDNFWQKFRGTSSPSTRVIPFNDPAHSFLPLTIKQHILSKLGCPSLMCPKQFKAYIPYIKEQCYRQQYLREELEQLEAEAQMYNSFHDIAPAFLYSYLLIGMLKLPYQEIQFNLEYALSLLFPITKLVFAVVLMLYTRLVCKTKYAKLTEAYYQLLFSSFDISSTPSDNSSTLKRD